MSNNWLVTGLKRALVVGGALVVGACDLDGLLGNDGGRVRITLAPDGGVFTNVIPDSSGVLLHGGDDDDEDRRHLGSFSFQTANVTLASVMVRTEDGELIELDSDLPITVDVVKIDGGKQVQLPDGFLPPGNYDQVVIVITAVQGVTNNGTVITIEPPGGGWTSVIPICPFAVAEGETAAVGLGFNVRNSFLQLGSNHWSFQPRFRSLSSLSDCVDAES